MTAWQKALVGLGTLIVLVNTVMLAAWIIPHFPSIVDIQCGEKAILL